MLKHQELQAKNEWLGSYRDSSETWRTTLFIAVRIQETYNFLTQRTWSQNTHTCLLYIHRYMYWFYKKCKHKASERSHTWRRPCDCTFICDELIKWGLQSLNQTLMGSKQMGVKGHHKKLTVCPFEKNKRYLNTAVIGWLCPNRIIRQHITSYSTIPHCIISIM